MKRIIICFCVCLSFITVSSYASDLQKCDLDYGYFYSPFRTYKLGLRESPDVSPLDHPLLEIRINNISKPGDYIIPPYFPHFHPVPEIGESDVNFIQSLIEPYMSKEYYDSSIHDFIESYEDTLTYNRKEFYLDFYSNDVLMIISGLYYRFAHIIVFTEYDSKKSFVQKANHFFNLPPIDVKNVEYDEPEYNYEIPNPRYFYSYKNKKHNIKLTGYPVLQSILRNKEVYTSSKRYIVIDLTVYAEKEGEEKE